MTTTGARAAAGPGKISMADLMGGGRGPSYQAGPQAAKVQLFFFFQLKFKKTQNMFQHF